MDTIYALATPPGRSGVAVVRVSGPAAGESLRALAGKIPRTRQAALVTLKHPDSGAVIDRALALYFAGPASFTGEDVAEYHLHGGRAVIDGLIAALATQDRHRLAEPGEFTRRAFENGKMDLTEAEAVADLINAETALQKEQALGQMGGALRDLYHGWADRLAHALAHLEADIDFPDEDLPGGVAAATRPVLAELRAEIAAHLADNRRGERLRDGIHVAVIGAPNAGKSSLVNALAQRDVAIVSALAGTTRDVIEVHLDLGGYPVIIADTAGLRPEQVGASREGHDQIEDEGIRRALARAQAADLKMLVYDASQPAKDAATAALEDADCLIVYNKADLIRAAPSSLSPPGLTGGPIDRLQHYIDPSVKPEDGVKNRGDGIAVSAQTGAGMQAMTERLVKIIAALMGNKTAVAPTRARHRQALQETAESLTRALHASQTPPMPELMAEDVFGWPCGRSGASPVRSMSRICSI
jgi:tRNA modification GTPase